MNKPIKANRRTFIKTSVFGVIGTMNIPVFFENYTHATKMNNAIKDVSSVITQNGELNNKRFAVHATFETQGEIRINTGVGNESITVTVASDAKDAQDPTISWRYNNAAAGNNYQGKITVGGRETPTFQLRDQLSEWTEYYRRIREDHPLAKRQFTICIENRGEYGRLLINGLLMHEWAFQESYDTSTFQVTANNGAAVVGTPETEPLALTPDEELFWPMDISARFNAKSIAGDNIEADSLPERDKLFRVDEIPFIIGSSSLGGYDHLDIGRSWFREGNGNFGSPNDSSFGGRWMGVHSDNPTRFQFRLPNRTPKAIHLLAVADGRENSIPRLTAQFYRVASGYPVSITSPQVPLATAQADVARCLPIRTISGKTLNLWHVVVPFNPGLLQQMPCYDDANRDHKYLHWWNSLTNREMLEVEFTKDVSAANCTAHGAGLPSSVQLFAATIAYPDVEVRFDPDAYGNIWTAPEVPSYTVSLTNSTEKNVSVKLRMDSVSYSGTEKLDESLTVDMAPFEAKTATIQVPVQRFGHHDLTLNVTAGTEESAFKRTLSYLRQREHEARSFDVRGYMFGYWNWKGMHATPFGEEEIRLMGPLGMESTSMFLEEYSTSLNSQPLSQQGEEDVEKYGMKCFYLALPIHGYDDAVKYKETVNAQIKDELNTARNPKIYDPAYTILYGEPSSTGTFRTFPEFYGEPALVLNEQQRRQFQILHDMALELTKEIRKNFPDLKVLMPWGDICFPIPFLKENDEYTTLMDGMGIDFLYGEALPEAQLSMLCLHRCYQFQWYWNQYKPDVKPVIPTVEGPCIMGVLPAGQTQQQFADHTVRTALMLSGYGVTRQFAMCSPAECSDYWGEGTYGSGVISRLPELNPHVCYSAMGTLIRHLRWMEFVDWKPTGSLSVYCHHYRDSKTGKDMFVLWTLRGKREVSMAVPAGAVLEIYDSMDNLAPLEHKNDLITFTIDASPVFLYGPDEFTTITLGDPDHSDAAPGEHTKSLGYMVDISHQDTAPTLIEGLYTGSSFVTTRRFLTRMDLARVTVDHQGKEFTALSISLPSQATDRGVMPFFTTLLMDRPVDIPGKASHLSMWVKGASDWGRVVYVLLDAKGEKWISTSGNDDRRCETYFNFDGWRLLRFKMPSNAPYDRFREANMESWGSSGGNGIVDLPLRIEKIYIERRPKAMYVNSLEPTDPSPVLLGELIAEYASPDDMGEAPVLLDRIEMPSPPQSFQVMYSVRSGNGSITASVNRNPFASGDRIEEGSYLVFTATPDEGYYTKAWRQNGTLIDEIATNTFTIPNLTYIAMITVEFEMGTGNDKIPDENQLKAWIQGSTLNVSNLEEGKPWYLYNMSGAIIQQGIGNGETVKIPLPAKGVYIIQSENRTLKVSYFN